MSLTRANEGMLRSHLEQFLKQRPDEILTGFRCADWDGSGNLRVAGRECTLHWCPSVLAVREAVMRSPVPGTLRVILTDRDDKALGLDLLARFTRQRLLELDPWIALRQIFDAQTLDGRLASEPWLAEALLEAMPPGGYPRVAAGALGLDSAWAAYLEIALGLHDGAADPVDLLRWSLGPQGPQRLMELDAERFGKVIDHLRRHGGGASAAIVRLARQGHAVDAPALGLICHLLYGVHLEPTQAVVAARASGLLEARLDGVPLPAADGRRWATAATALMDQWSRDSGAQKTLRQTLRRADELARELRVETLAFHSPWLTAGHRQRLERFAGAIGESLDQTPVTPVPGLDTLAEAAAQHHRSRTRPTPSIPMALRLVRWLARQEDPSGHHGHHFESFPEAAAHYATELAWVDRARAVPWAHDAGEPLSAAVRRLLERVLSHREAFNRRFGELARGWFEADGEHPSVVPVEQILDKVVAPLVHHGPVLLLVLDGLSFAVYHRLHGDLLGRGLEPQQTDGGSLLAVAALPGTTRVSRVGLLCGHLDQGPAGGGQSLERKGFASHHSLLAANVGCPAPVLFHKADLRAEGGGLSEDVRKAIQNPRQKAVGVVLNAIDDQLGRGDQLLTPWSIETLRHLGPLLDAAEDADRTVVLTSDHGHVLDWDLTLAKDTDTEALGERHRATTKSPDEGETLIRGRRVVAEGGDLIVPWSETLRYTSRKAGYHGGISPQELLVPLAVLAPHGVEIPGWSVAEGTLPSWWEGDVERPSSGRPDRATTQTMEEETPAANTVPAAGVESGPVQRSLFEDPGPLATELTPEPIPDGTTEALNQGPWANLFGTPLWQAQAERASAGVLGRRQQLVELLDLLELHGGRLSVDAVSRSLNVGRPRLRSLVSQFQRLLNVDGYPVLDFDEVAGELHFDRPLLDEQFSLGTP